MEKNFVSTLLQATSDSPKQTLVASEEARREEPKFGLKSFLTSLISPRKSVKKLSTKPLPRSPLQMHRSDSPKTSRGVRMTPRQSPRRLRTSRPLGKLNTMMTSCAEVQQSLTSIWQSACDNATGSLQLLETSRRTITSSTAQTNPWKHNPKYQKSRAALDARLQQSHSLKSLTSLSKALARQVSGQMDEDEVLLEEIRQFKKQAVELGDTFKPIHSPRLPKGSGTDRSPNTSSALGQLNQFIFKENSKYMSRSATIEKHKRQVEATMQNIEASPEVLEKARLLVQRERRRSEHKKVFVANLMTAEEKQERQQLLTDIQSEQRDLHTKWRIEDMYHQTSVKQFNGRPA